MYQVDGKKWVKHLDFLLIDLLMLQLAYFLSYTTRMGGGIPYTDTTYMSCAVVIFLESLAFLMVDESYHDIMRRGVFRELISVLELVFVSFVGVLVFLFFTKQSENYSRLMQAYFFVYSLELCWIGRVGWKLFLQRRHQVTDDAKRRLLLVSTKERAISFLDQLRKEKYEYFDVAGLVLVDWSADEGDELHGVPVVATPDDILAYIQTRWIDEVLIGLPEGRELPRQIMDQLHIMGITTHRAIDLDAGSSCMRTVDTVAGNICLTESIRIVSLEQLIVKRAMDILGGFVGVLITLVLTVFVGQLIWLADPGPIFFSQERVGRNGRKFKILKFRSMYMDAEDRKRELMARNNIKDGLMFKVDNDPRILGSGPDGTRHGIGWFIRKTSIDECPQFWAVLMGNMSLVGTRPPTVDEWEKYQAHHRARLAIKPGLSGLWQVSGRSKITDFEEVVKLDLQYINNWSFLEDVRIILKTIKVLFTGDGAE